MIASQTPRPAILIVEDDPMIAELLQAQLGGARYDVTWARSGEVALMRMRQIKPALVLLDLGLPEMDGFEVLTELRRSAAFAKTPVIVLTARHVAADVRRALLLGASDYIAKPYDAAELLRRIARRLTLQGETASAPSRFDQWTTAPRA
jgi:DNA-binding response OmpR family regulator